MYNSINSGQLYKQVYISDYVQCHVETRYKQCMVGRYGITCCVIYVKMIGTYTAQWLWRKCFPRNHMYSNMVRPTTRIKYALSITHSHSVNFSPFILNSSSNMQKVAIFGENTWDISIATREKSSFSSTSIISISRMGGKKLGVSMVTGEFAKCLVHRFRYLQWVVNDTICGECSFIGINRKVSSGIIRWNVYFILIPYLKYIFLLGAFSIATLSNEFPIIKIY